MERIYFNLLSNASKFTLESGEVSVSLSTDGNLVLFSVFNSGSYISPAQANAIFNRFYQIDSHQAGTGIGLALVHSFVKMLQGEIDIHSDDRGTTFTVKLPLEQAPIGQLETTPEQHLTATDEELLSVSEVDIVVPTDKPTILVIDDNPEIQNYIALLLEGQYKVLRAAEAQTGISLAMKYVPDLIVSDVMMPGMDGVTCCQRLKSELQTCHIPIILLTAYSLDEQRI